MNVYVNQTIWLLLLLFKCENHDDGDDDCIALHFTLNHQTPRDQTDTETNVTIFFAKIQNTYEYFKCFIYVWAIKEIIMKKLL